MCFRITIGQCVSSILQVDKFALYFFLIAIGSMIFSAMQTGFPMIAVERQMRRVRIAYLKALLRQPMEWHDTNKAGEVSSRLAEETIQMQVRCIHLPHNF